MTFLFPLGLWLTLVVPILVGLYIWAQRRRQKYALRYASTDSYGAKSAAW